MKSETIKVLLVDDDEINRILTVSLFRKLGVRIDTACNGVDAIRKLTECDFDLILMDIDMPVMDGISACRYIRNQMSTSKRSVKIVAMTGYDTDAEIERCHTAGMDDYISKPYEVNTLLQMMDLPSPVRKAS